MRQVHWFANDANVSFDYEYDGAGRLIKERANRTGWIWQPVSGDSWVKSYEANALDQYLKKGPSGGGMQDLTYDGRGNLAFDASAAGGLVAYGHE